MNREGYSRNNIFIFECYPSVHGNIILLDAMNSIFIHGREKEYTVVRWQ